MDSFWYAINVRSRHEFKVLDRLSKLKVEAFLPIVERLRQWKDRKKAVNFPLFPCYIFVHIHDNREDRLAVLKITGVVKFLGMIRGRPEPIPEEQIISLKRLVESKEPLDPYPYLKEGQRIRIRSGLLAGIEGMLVEKLGQHKLVLSVDVLKQGAAVEIDASDVERI